MAHFIGGDRSERIKSQVWGQRPTFVDPRRKHHFNHNFTNSIITVGKIPHSFNTFPYLSLVVGGRTLGEFWFPG